MLEVIKYKDTAEEGYYTQKELVAKINELVMMFNNCYYALALESGQKDLADQYDKKIKEQNKELEKFYMDDILAKFNKYADEVSAKYEAADEEE